MNVCPECRAGKCRNCTIETYDEHDALVVCECDLHGHPVID